MISALSPATSEPATPASAGFSLIEELDCDRCTIASDLHLDGTTRREVGFRRLLDAARAHGGPLILLGDVFEYWFGRQQLQTDLYRREIELIADATHSGQSIVFVPGNRDFLVDATFARVTGVRIAGDALSVRCAGQHLHLTHGDLFSTADVGYHRLRGILRHRMLVFLAHQLPAWVVHPLALGLRRQSERSIARKPMITMEPDRNAVAEILASGFDAVICGHFHQLRDERVGAGAGAGRFVVLEPFEDHGYTLSIDERGWFCARLEQGPTVPTAIG